MPKGAATSISFVSNTTLLAGSTDHSVVLYNLKTGQVIRRFRGHSGIVNSVDVLKGRGLFVSGSDDGTVRVWQEDAREEVEVVELGYPITAVRCAASLTPLPLSSVFFLLMDGVESNADSMRARSTCRSSGQRMVSNSTLVESTTMCMSSPCLRTASATRCAVTRTRSRRSPSAPLPRCCSPAPWTLSSIAGMLHPSHLSSTRRILHCIRGLCDRLLEHRLASKDC